MPAPCCCAAEKGQFVWKHPEYGAAPVTLDLPPPPERFTEIVRAVGHEVRDAGRVEVPFHCVIPAQEAWWTGDSRGGIDVPLGRAGAMKLQDLDLGRGTSQHVLISGKTGSGKSTLLHVLITNVALRYSPDEIELYLVDFKKGVEFKAYARHQLPHARVIAIESEREFGLSVLQRLDAELRSRGDQFRRLGVQDLKGFRNAQPDEKLARILLMIDEFQELFVEDDRIAQEAALLLDRLVRQGRAFGIHVLLGSQTLGGAYSLARSTIGQMAVRIALQCSEADAHLILSEENTAARLLTRPGEAIYNDANGLFEGNHPFQIVWLSDDERDDYLRRLAEFSNRRNVRRPPPIVFEGNVPADQSENLELQSSLAACAAGGTVAPPTEPHFWFGSAVAIKGPTSAVFARQAGSNLLMVGHREEASLGVMATGLIGLAAQHGPLQPGGDCPGGAVPHSRRHAAGGPRGRLLAAGSASFALRRHGRPGPGGRGNSRRDLRRTGSSPAGRARRPAADLPPCLQPGAVPRPPQRRRFLLRPRGRETRHARQDVRRDSPRRAELRDPHHRLERLLRHGQPLTGPAGPPRFRPAGAVPDERHRQQQPDGLAGGGPAGRASGHLLRRRSRPDGEVPALRIAFRRMAGRSTAAVVPRGGETIGQTMPAQSRSLGKNLLVCGLLLLGVYVVFGQTVRYSFVQYDDSDYVYENPFVQSGLTLRGVVWAFLHTHASNWHPLTWISHMLDCQWFGLDAGLHHATNFVLHGISACLLFALLRRLTGDFWPSALVAAIFAVHPLRVESVAWVAERKDVLSGLFFFLTLLAYERYVRQGQPLGRYLWATLLLILGLMAKPMLVTLPFVTLLLDYWPLGRFREAERSADDATDEEDPPARLPPIVPLVMEKLPWMVLAATSCAITAVAQRQAMRSFDRLPLGLRVPNAVVSYAAYLKQAVWPQDLAVYYPHSGKLPPLLALIGAIVLLAGISWIAVRLRRSCPYVLVGWLWYAGMLVPVIGLVQVGDQAMADRYTYLPQVGLFIALAWACGASYGGCRRRVRP